MGIIAGVWRGFCNTMGISSGCCKQHGVVNGKNHMHHGRDAAGVLVLVQIGVYKCQGKSLIPVGVVPWRGICWDLLQTI